MSGLVNYDHANIVNLNCRLIRLSAFNDFLVMTEEDVSRTISNENSQQDRVKGEVEGENFYRQMNWNQYQSTLS